MIKNRTFAPDVSQIEHQAPASSVFEL